MAEKKFRARLSRSQNRKSWSVIFTHPIRTGKDGGPLRTRGGLGTEDDTVANNLVNELNELLGDESYWKVGARDTAARHFHSKVVALFYDDIETKSEDPWKVRDEVLPLPSSDDGYSKILLVGATGAGKTTLLRQLIGSHPERDRFPSTSTAKTTIFDIELIVAPSPYSGVVSFLSRERVRSYIEECVAAAVSSALEKESDQIILRRLLEHSEQRFRLSYLLGTLSPDTSEDLEDEAEAAISATNQDGIDVKEDEKKAFQGRLADFLKRIKEIAEHLPKNIAEELGVDPASLNHEDREAFLQLLDQIDTLIRDHEDAQTLIEDILSEVESKFSVIDSGTYERDKSDWPRRWFITTDDRKDFIRTINRFSSNYAQNFGKLLAPLVQGMRVAGPFIPAWLSADSVTPRFVFIDGEGLGHTPTSAAVLPTNITKRYDTTDVILLVDSATQPMQAASQAVLQSIVAGGHESKLALVFTHFDQVTGPNLPNTAARKNHLLASLDNTIHGIEDSIKSNAGKRLRHALQERTFFASQLQEELSEGARLTRSELTKLLTIFEAASRPVEFPVATPVYDIANLVLLIRVATEQFQESWSARLGLSTKAGITPEHWTRVKALARRFANQWEDQYDTLRPVADLIKVVSEHIADFIANPRDWKTPYALEDARQAAVNRVTQVVYARLHDLITNRLFHDHIHEWLSAFSYKGTGSTHTRARDIQGIYEEAAPIPGAIPTKTSMKFLDVFRDLFRSAASSAGAEIIG